LKTFLDSGVLLSAWHATTKEAETALAVIEDRSRQLLTSEIVRLELLPKPIFFKQSGEVNFYEDIFSKCRSDKVDAELYRAAFNLAKTYGLAAADAFNLASAIRLGAEEFVTSELPGKPMYRVKEIKVISLHAAAAR
jgi:predicted nucleic acid-binding protein